MALCHLKGEKLIWYEKIHCELKYNLRLAYENFIQMNVKLSNLIFAKIFYSKIINTINDRKSSR